MTEHQVANDTPLADAPCFIEQQFPVAKVSMESYKERMSNQGQTLTGLGKWWGRKPLVLVRAALLGLLTPASDDPEKDRDIFLKLMTMDRDGLHRRFKTIPGSRLVQELLAMPPSIQERFLDPNASSKKPRLRRLSKDEREELKQMVFDRLSYDEKLRFCDRPEQIDGPSEEAWAEINAHLGTHAASLPELVQELGRLRFGHRPRVGDAFCGGGSIPFEAARLGCDAYGSDLNPVAALLTWASLNIIGGGEAVAEAVQEAQRRIFDAVDRQITEWGIEHNSLGWRADAYLYCVEVVDPESGWRIPLLPNMVIGQKTNTTAKLVPDAQNKRYDIEILEGVSDAEMEAAKQTGTVQDTRLVPPDGSPSTPIEVIRHNLRQWASKDIVPRPDDVFQERLYCIRWVETYVDERGREQTRRHYRAPTPEDLGREEKVLTLLQERFYDWQAKGHIPFRRVEPGAETARLQRERGWTYWHHLFNPRQVLLAGLLNKATSSIRGSIDVRVGALLGLQRFVDHNSKLSGWSSSAGKELVDHVFANQALNVPFNHGVRGFIAGAWELRIKQASVYGCSRIEPADARSIHSVCDIWLTDPPYADSISYEEISEFFLAWSEGSLHLSFPDWYTDSKRALAVKGSDIDFRRSMVDCYGHLAEKMPDNGLQIVMFTHQDASVWADLTMILWAAGLRVTAAWTIATETDSALKQGNYVQGTVLLVLRKRTATEPVFLDEITYVIEQEVRCQLDSMTALEDDSDPNFGDADYQLAAYAAALRVLTAQPIEEINPEREILRERTSGEVGPVEALIRRAVKIACDHLVPRDFDPDIWRHLSPMERFYLKGVEVESHAEYRNGVYQELARGFGAANYTDLLASTRANETRLKSPSELGRRGLAGAGFGGSLVRQCLYAVHQVTQNEDAQAGLNWLRTELPDYWSNRTRIAHILAYLSKLERVSGMKRWRKDGRAAAILSGAVRNDHV